MTIKEYAAGCYNVLTTEQACDMAQGNEIAPALTRLVQVLRDRDLIDDENLVNILALHRYGVHVE